MAWRQTLLGAKPTSAQSKSGNMLLRKHMAEQTRIRAIAAASRKHLLLHGEGMNERQRTGVATMKDGAAS